MDRFTPNNQKLQTRFGLSFSLVGLLVVGFLAAGWGLNARAQLLAALEENTREITSLAALQIDSNALAAISSRRDEGTTSYNTLWSALNNIRQAGSTILGAYVLRLNENGNIMIAAASTSQAVHHAGDPFPASALIQARFSGMDQTLVQSVTADNKLPGMWGFAPIRDSGGRLVGVLAIRADISTVDQKFWQQVGVLAMMVLVGVGLLGTVGWLTGRRLNTPLSAMMNAVSQVLAGDLSQRLPLITSDEVGQVAYSVNTLLDQVQSQVGELEQQISLGENRLAEQDQYLQAVANVAQAATRELDGPTLARQMAAAVLAGFGLQHIGLFIMDADRRELLLLGGAGEAIQPLLRQGARLSPHEGVVAASISSSRALLAAEPGMSGRSALLPDLPAAVSEAVVPLRARDRVTGVLTLHSDRKDAFTPAALLALQAAADQAAIALDNVDLLAQNQAALQRVSQAYNELSRKAWQELLRTRAGLTARCDERGARVEQNASAAPDGVDPLALGAPVADTTLGVSPLPAVTLPIRVRGLVIGAFEARKARHENWSKEEMGLLETLLEQLSIALESARLYNDSQLRAERERMAGEITARMRETLEIETILQTAALEMRRALDLGEVEVRMGLPKAVAGNGHAAPADFSVEHPGDEA